MGKLGKRARKFSRKNLQSVERKKRKFNAMRENSRRNKRRNSGNEALPESDEKVASDQAAELRDLTGTVGGNSLNPFYSEDEGSSIEDASDSDGYLSEDSDCPYISDSGDDHDLNGLQCKELVEEIAKKEREIERLKEKDPGFLKFLDNHNNNLKNLRFNDASSDEEIEEEVKDDDLIRAKGKTLSKDTIDVWCWMVSEDDTSTFPSLLNAYRSACHFGISNVRQSSSTGIPNKEVYSRILTFVLTEADGIFQRLLNIPNSKYNFTKISGSPKWTAVRPLIKSYLRSSIILLKQLTDNQILTFALSKLTDTVMLFSAFPSLLRRLVKTAVNFWASGDEHLSSAAYSLLHYIATELSAEWLNVCLTLSYQTFISCCQFIDAANFKQIEILRAGLVEIYSVDIQCSYPKVSSALKHLALVLQSGLKTKSEEELRRIHSWQYVNCIEVWVEFITKNIREHNLQPLLNPVIQIVMGVAHLFPGLRYFPLRIRCVRMLNKLSSSSGIFIPVIYLLLDSLECGGSDKTEAARSDIVDFSFVLKVSKQVLKSSEFQEKCLLSTFEQLSAHLTQWSYSISFPELAAIPLIFLKKFIQETTVESHRRLVRRLIDQLEGNRNFIERKRDDVSFSPKDQASVDSFLQFEKSSGTHPVLRLNSRRERK